MMRSRRLKLSAARVGLNGCNFWAVWRNGINAVGVMWVTGSVAPSVMTVLGLVHVGGVGWLKAARVVI